jgi:hypothetical protein
MKAPGSLSSYTAEATSHPVPERGPAIPGPGGPQRSRRWEKRQENRAYSYRVGVEVDALLDQAVAEMEAEGWVCTKSQVARAWLLAGFRAWQQGEVEVEGYERRAGSFRRTRE